LSDAIEFHTTNRKDCDAECNPERPSIMVSLALNYHLITVLIATAHEMIHLYQYQQGTDNRYQHNDEFIRIAKRICRRYAWDVGQFTGGC